MPWVTFTTCRKILEWEILANLVNRKPLPILTRWISLLESVYAKYDNDNVLGAIDSISYQIQQQSQTFTKH